MYQTTGPNLTNLINVVADNISLRRDGVLRNIQDEFVNEDNVATSELKEDPKTQKKVYEYV